MKGIHKAPNRCSKNAHCHDKFWSETFFWGSIAPHLAVFIGPYEMMRTESRQAACKASALVAAPSPRAPGLGEMDSGEGCAEKMNR